MSQIAPPPPNQNQTPTRYPSSLSQTATRGGPSRPSRPTQNTQYTHSTQPARPTRAYPSPSIDSDIASPPSASLHEYSSLADLLQQAGYKETRVYTPEAEKVRLRRRPIKKTLDEAEGDDEEIDALYGTYGFDRSSAALAVVGGKGAGGKAMQHQHITEPSMPMKRSSSILRSLAIQDASDRISSSTQSQYSEGGSSTPDHSWWTNWGRATKVISPEASSGASAPFQPGLGLAKGGEGVRKVKSTWELERSRPRRAGTDSPQQEERAPMPRTPSAPNEALAYSSATGYTPTKATSSRSAPTGDYSVFSPPPPIAIEEEAYGYCPLPEDYEAQCTDDEAMYAMGVNDLTDIYSLGSASVTASESGMSRTPSVQSTVSSAPESEGGYVVHSSAMGVAGSGSGSEGSSFSDEFLKEVNEVGKRLMIGAVEYDESLDYESPPTHISPLPPTDAIPPTPILASSALPHCEEEEEEAVEEQTPPPVEVAKKSLKYGDRATRLRLAHSTPALKQTAAAGSAPPLPEGWLGAIRSTLIGRPKVSQTTTVGPSFASTSAAAAPIRISPITPALPTLIRSSPVICDSTSTEAEDLPPLPTPTLPPALTRNHTAPAVPTTSTGAVPSTMASLALRLRPSLAKLRHAVLGPVVVEPADDGTSPVLSPRLDWGEQGEQFAGWSPARRPAAGCGSNSAGGVEKLFGLGLGDATDGKGEIDYSKSFFYKPGTPRKATQINQDGDVPFTPPRSGTNTCAATSTTTNVQGSGSGSAEQGPARRQRSIKSLRAALLLPVAPAPAPPVPPVPAIPAHLMTPKMPSTSTSTPGPNGGMGMQPPILAIQSPGAWQPRELVLEGEEWDARDGGAPGDWGRKGRSTARSAGGKGLKKRRSKKLHREREGA